MDARKLDILQHSLGLDQYGRGTGYRNHFCSGGEDEFICRELVAEGLMHECPVCDIVPGYNCYVTEAGKKAIREHSPAPPKLTRSQKRYQRFLDADCGLSFKEWLQYTKA